VRTRPTPPTSKNPKSNGRTVPQHSSPAVPKALRPRSVSVQRRGYVRPLDDGATELVRVIQFLWREGRGIQPVMMVERELLN
jgi:hypothetical protein